MPLYKAVSAVSPFNLFLDRLSSGSGTPCLGTDGAARGDWCLYKAKSSTALILSAAFCLHITQDTVCRQLESLYNATHSKAAALTFSFLSLD